MAKAVVPVKFPVVSFMRLMEIAVAVLVVIWAVFYRRGLAMVHPVLMVIGPVLLTGKATLAYRTLPGTRNCKILVHLFLQFLAVCLGLIGLWAAWKFPSGKGGDDIFLLEHWNFGLVTILFFAIHWGMGFVTFWFPGGWRSSYFGRMMWQHVLGSLVYSLAVITCGWGFLEMSTLLQARKRIARCSMEALLMNSLGLLMYALCALEFIRLRCGEDEFFIEQMPWMYGLDVS